MTFSFKDFLQMVDGIRDDTKGLLKAAVLTLFKSYNLSWTSPPSIMANEVPALMMELTFFADCCSSEEELMLLVDACDNDAGSDLDFEQLVALISKVTEKCRVGQREAEAVVASQLGYTSKQVLQMRESFAALSTTGTIGVPELKKWFKQINPDVNPSTKDVQDLILEVSPLPLRSHLLDADLNSMDASDDFGEDGYGDDPDYEP